MNFCPHCGAAALKWQTPPGDDHKREVCQSCRTVHYSNPKIVTGCLPVWEDKVLLCRRAIEPGYGLWNIPSGYLENGESVEAGAIREVREEAAARVELTYLISLYNLERINQVYLQFVGQLIGGDYGVGEESLDTQLFTESEIPWPELAFTSSTFTLHRYFEDRQAKRQRLHRAAYPAI